MGEQEWLLMVKVRADKDRITNLGNIECVAVETEHEELGYFQPSRLIDKADLMYGYPKQGDLYFSAHRAELLESFSNDQSGQRYLIHRKPKDKWQAWADKSPFHQGAWGIETTKAISNWLQEGIEIGKEKP